ncbi:GNAT family N-acetyltransferase [Georgenia sp. SYP-B2076]|uniref:GNAT family N-acetyltransferase n=1 Tax=Georgenia sp. SYP-B2076 TaxID=2495881 RepID=UPI0013DFF035|nr:GNAT family N-acetyltransferase [Georgenia sp. SYP-B2076]
MTVTAPPAGGLLASWTLSVHAGPVPADVVDDVARLRGEDPRLAARAAHASAHARAQAEGRLVGFCLAEEPNTAPGASWAHHAFPDRPELGALVVDPAWRGRGLGRGLVAALAGHLTGAGRVPIGVTATDSRAVAINRWLGARVVGAFVRDGHERWVWEFPAAG